MISVIIPAYNVEECIGKAVESVLTQTYSEIEIIIVDDGSTDGTAEVIDNYASKNSAKIRALHIPNGGVTNARLTGISCATGDWIGFVDGDDEIEPDMYERLIGNALKYSADISHCGYQMVFSDGRINYFHNTGRLVQQDKPTGLMDLLDGSMVEPGLWNKLFRKTLFYSLLHDNPMDLSIKINEDLLMNFYLFCQAKRSVFEDFCPYHYIVRSASASRQKLNEHKIYDPIKVKEQIMEAAPESVQAKAKQAYLSTCINVYNSIILTDLQEYKTDRKNIRQIITAHWEFSKFLTKKQQLLGTMIRHLPSLYKPVYRFYATHILKSPYV